MKGKATESQLQESVIEYLGYFYPKALAIHVPNEGKRSKYHVKKSGIKAGVPDVMIFEKRGDFLGFALELKVGSNPPTEKQKEFMKALEGRGWLCHVSWNFDNAKEFIDRYLNLK